MKEEGAVKGGGGTPPFLEVGGTKEKGKVGEMNDEDVSGFEADLERQAEEAGQNTEENTTTTTHPQAHTTTQKS